MIAPFWSEINTSAAGKASFRVLTASDEASNRELFDKINDIVCQVGFEPEFAVNWIVVATWNHVAFDNTESACRVVNTFQVVIARYDTSTYAILNYNDTNWSSGTVDGGDSVTGLGGQQAHVGFNKGDGTVYYYLPEFFSGDDVITLEDGSNVNLNGRWAFRIDEDSISGPQGPSFSFVEGEHVLWEHDGYFELCLERTGGCIPVAADIGLIIESSGTNATGVDDFTPTLFDVSFDADDSTGCIKIDIIDDALVETNETLQLTIDPKGYGSAGDISKTVITIVDNDVLNVFTLEESSFDVIESQLTLRVKILRSYQDIPGFEPEGSVVLRTITQSAVDPHDFANIAEAVVEFDPGQTERTEIIYILNDVVVEDDEYLKVVLLNPQGGVIGEIPEAIINIINDDSGYSIAMDAYTVIESEGPVEVTVNRNGDLSNPGQVRFIKRNGSAVEGEDYPTEVVVLEFPAGVPSVTGLIQITNDNHVEALQETFDIVLVTPQNGGVTGITEAEITVIDDDSGFSFASQVFNVNEQDGVVIVTIVRVGNLNVEATVYVSTGQIGKRKRRQIASAGNDFVSLSELPVTFQAGQSSRTVEIAIGDDNTPERDEEILVILSLAPDDENNELIGEARVASIIIHDDEIAPDFVALSTDVFPAFEQEQHVIIPIARTGSNEGSCSVRISTRLITSGPAATPHTDFTPLSSELVEFQPGIRDINFNIEIEDDVDLENIESFEVILSDASGCDILGTGRGRVDIYDNDAADGDVLIRLGASQTQVLENEGSVSIQIIRYGDIDEPASVYIETVNNGQATPTADYIPVSASRVSFDPGQQEQDLVITITNDGIPESFESFQVRLFNPHDSRLGDISEAEVVIEDDDFDDDFPYTVFSFQEESIEVLESSKVARVTILRGNYRLQTSYITVATEPATINRATGGSDYQEISSHRIEFLPGESSYTLEIPIVDDSVQEPREGFRVTLSEAVNGILGDIAQTLVSIIDDDCDFGFGNDEYEIHESGQALSVSIVRSGYIQRSASVHLESSYLVNEAEGRDFDAISTTVKFPSGIRYLHVDIRIRDDAEHENDEVFELSLSRPVNGSLGDPRTTRVIIIDDDLIVPDDPEDGGLATATILGIVGGVAGAIALIAVIVGGVCCFWLVTRNTYGPTRRPRGPYPSYGPYGRSDVRRPRPSALNNRAYELRGY